MFQNKKQLIQEIIELKENNRQLRFLLGDMFYTNFPLSPDGKNQIALVITDRDSLTKKNIETIRKWLDIIVPCLIGD